jgi:two-component system chemotaxis sensor kinase CheA
MGIIVDHLLGQQEIVIKALDDYLGNAAGVAGATIRGDGKVVLIVDVLELMEKHRNIDYQEIAKTMEVRHAQ